MKIDIDMIWIWNYYENELVFTTEQNIKIEIDT